MFIDIEDDVKRVALNVSIASPVAEELDRYVSWALSQSPRMKKALVVEKILAAAMKRDKDFQNSKAAASLPRKVKVA
jgi:hypothetical protein